MNADAEAAAVVRAAPKPPEVVKRVRLCQYAGAFCASCPDADSLPCVLAGGYWDCATCTAPDCPCMIGWTIERRAAYQEWRERLEAGNAKTRERKARYGRKRWYAGWRQESRAYSQGRTCGGDDCDEPITDKNTSGLCKRCAAMGRGKGGDSLAGS